MYGVNFRTNITDNTDLQKIAPVLNREIGFNRWTIDLSTNDKTLFVYAHTICDEVKTVRALSKAGFTANNLEDYYAVY